MQKKFVAFVLVFVLSITFVPYGNRFVPANASVYSDTDNNWASIEIQKWTDYGVISESGSNFRPDDAITRGEIAFWLDKIMNYKVKATKSFNDLEYSPYKDSLLRVYQADVLTDSGNNMLPNEYINRQDMITLLGKAFDVEQSVNNSTFTDDYEIANYAKAFVATFQSKGYIKGYPNGTFMPRETISRAETIKIIDTIVKEIVKTQSLNTDVKGTVIVNSPYSTLSGMTVNGDVIISEGVAEGSVTIKNVKITGKLVIRGGGPDSVNLVSSQVNSVVVQNKENSVKVSADINSVVNNTLVKSGNKLVTLDGNFSNVDVKSDVSVAVKNGKANRISVSESNSKVTIESNSNVQEFNVLNTAPNTTVNVYGSINTLNVRGQNSVISGTGAISSSKISANSVAFNVKDAKLSIDSNVTGTTIFSASVSGGRDGYTSGNGLGNFSVGQSTSVGPYVLGAGSNSRISYYQDSNGVYYYDSYGRKVYGRYLDYDPYYDPYYNGGYYGGYYGGITYYNPWGISVSSITTTGSRTLEVYMPYHSGLSFWVSDTSLSSGYYYNYYDYDYNYYPPGYYGGKYNYLDEYGNYVYFYRDGYYSRDGRIVTIKDGYYDKYGNLLTYRDGYFGYYDRYNKFSYCNDGIYDRYGNYIYGRYGYYDGIKYNELDGTLIQYAYYDNYGRYYYNNGYYNNGYYGSSYYKNYNNNTVSSTYYNSSKGCYELTLNFDLTSNKSYNLYVNNDGYVAAGKSFSWSGYSNDSSGSLSVYASNNPQTVRSGSTISTINLSANTSSKVYWEKIGGELPSNVAFDYINGRIYGSVSSTTTTGAYTSTYRGTDSNYNKGTISVTINVTN